MFGKVFTFLNDTRFVIFNSLFDYVFFTNV